MGQPTDGIMVLFLHQDRHETLWEDVLTIIVVVIIINNIIPILMLLDKTIGRVVVVLARAVVVHVDAADGINSGVSSYVFNGDGAHGVFGSIF
jgi:hypothetical protein